MTVANYDCWPLGLYGHQKSMIAIVSNNLPSGMILQVMFLCPVMLGVGACNVRIDSAFMQLKMLGE